MGSRGSGRSSGETPDRPTVAIPLAATVEAVVIYELWLATPAGQQWLDDISREGLPPLVIPRIGP